ncbi:MAG: hypothetical protein AAF639_02655 [Chloroflexota bacterium]
MADDFIGLNEQLKASKHRLDDAHALFNAVRWRGAMYMAGYSIECLLKVKLMQMYNCYNLRDLEIELQRRGVLATDATVFTHHLEALLRLTQAQNRLRQNHNVWPLFNIVNRWIPAWRYTANLSSREEAEIFLDAVENVWHWIEHNI